MGYWGVKSYENDDAAAALDAAFERVHGAVYDDLMDDRNPMTFDQVQQKLANAQTLATALEALAVAIGDPFDDWDPTERLAFAGIVVRHAEFEVPISEEVRLRALDWLEHEEVDWREDTTRRLRREKEMALLRSPRDN